MHGIENIAGLLLLAIIVAWIVFIFVFVINVKRYE